MTLTAAAANGSTFTGWTGCTGTGTTCTTTAVPPNINVPFLNEVLCDSGVKVSGFGCQPGDHYPRATHIVMHKLPKKLATMPNPCAGVPANPWCGGKNSVGVVKG